MNDNLFHTKFLNLLPSDYGVALAIIRDDMEMDDKEMDETKMLERLHEYYQVITVREEHIML